MWCEHRARHLSKSRTVKSAEAAKTSMHVRRCVCMYVYIGRCKRRYVHPPPPPPHTHAHTEHTNLSGCSVVATRQHKALGTHGEQLVQRGQQNAVVGCSRDTTASGIHFLNILSGDRISSTGCCTGLTQRWNILNTRQSNCQQ